MTLLDKHLEQIELCSSTIQALPFPRPRMFTNAMLHNQDITTLIRDTESHERALFSLIPPENERLTRSSADSTARRKTAFNASEESNEYKGSFQAPRRGTAVAAVLGGDLQRRIRSELGQGARETRGQRETQKDSFDVELLLQGAERLCGAYPMEGVLDRIAALRTRNTQVLESMEKYEGLVAEQSKQLGRMNRPSSFGFDDEDAATEVLAERGGRNSQAGEPSMTQEDLRLEEDEVAELERKKRSLEERVGGMEKDLGGLIR